MRTGDVYAQLEDWGFHIHSREELSPLGRVYRQPRDAGVEQVVTGQRMAAEAPASPKGTARTPGGSVRQGEAESDAADSRSLHT